MEVGAENLGKKNVSVQFHQPPNPPAHVLITDYLVICPFLIRLISIIMRTLLKLKFNIFKNPLLYTLREPRPVC